jgi:menaquinone-specific isochorismate synthase
MAAAPHALEEAIARAGARARAEGRPALLAWSTPAPRALDLPGMLRVLAGMEAPRALVAAPDGETVVASGAAATLAAEGMGRFDHVRLQAEALLARAEVVALPGAPPPRFVGGFAFADSHGAEGAWEAFPGALFLLPRLALVRRGGEGWVQQHRLVEGREDPVALARHLARAAQEATAPSGAPSLAKPGQPLPPFGSRVLERDAWTAEVRRALEAIRRGPLRKVVLARRVPVPLTAPLEGPEALARVASRYPDTFLYLVEPRGARHFLGATPELLVEVRGLALETAAVAGSAPRGATPAEDEALGRALVGSAKEQAEHGFVVDHLRQRLGDLGAKASAPPAPALLRLRNVQHLHTPLRAELPERLHALECAAALHPTPAVNGAPAALAQEFLQRAEGFPRGWYCGAVGWFDAAGDGTFAVALRCALVEAAEAWLFAGAGIVAGADPAREWEETNLKLEPMLEALGCR